MRAYLDDLAVHGGHVSGSSTNIISAFLWN